MDTDVLVLGADELVDEAATAVETTAELRCGRASVKGKRCVCLSAEELIGQSKRRCDGAVPLHAARGAHSARVSGVARARIARPARLGSAERTIRQRGGGRDGAATRVVGVVPEDDKP